MKIALHPIGTLHTPFNTLEDMPIQPAGRTLKLSDLDMLDGTPLLDLKPYVPDFDHPPEVRIGWLEAARAKMDESTSDDRFK